MGLTIRVLVLSQIPEATGNALLNLFSGDHARVAFGCEQMRPRLAEFTSVLNQLFEKYDQEGLKMPYSLEQFEREVKEEVLRKLTPEERLAGLDLRQQRELREILDQRVDAKKTKKKRGKS